MPVRPALAGDTRAPHRRGGRDGDRRDLRGGAGRRRGGRGGVRRRIDAVTDLREAMKPGAPQVWPEAPGNIAVDWAGLAANPDEMAAKVDEAMKSAAHVAQGLAGAPAHQRRLDGAARRHRELRQGERQLSAARLLAGRARHARRDGGRDGHSAGENPRDHRGGRRRVRAQDRPLSRIHRDAGRRKEDRPAGALDVGPQRSRS